LEFAGRKAEDQARDQAEALAVGRSSTYGRYHHRDYFGHSKMLLPLMLRVMAHWAMFDRKCEKQGTR